MKQSVEMSLNKNIEIDEEITQIKKQKKTLDNIYLKRLKYRIVDNKIEKTD